jgi:fluoride ion exporter CrcB/FEX
MQTEITAQRSMAIAEFSEYYTLSFDTRKMTNLASIAFFSSLGVLLRYGSGALFSGYLMSTAASVERDPGGILFHDLMVNVIGSGLMGLFTAFREELQSFSPALYVGLTTGLCGCATTFSAWASSMVVLAWDFDVGCTLYPFSSLLGTAIGFGLAYTSHSVGQHIATCLRHAHERFSGASREKQLLAAVEARASASQSHKASDPGASAAPLSAHPSESFGGAEADGRDANAIAVDSDERGESPPELNRGIMRYFYERDVTSECAEVVRLCVALALWFGLTGLYISLYMRNTQCQYQLARQRPRACAPAVSLPRARLTVQPAAPPSLSRPLAPPRPPLRLRSALAVRTRVLLLACIIAPAGAWMRYLVTFSNKHTPTFPLYTYLCNLIASILSIVIYVALTKVLPSAGEESLGADERYHLEEWLYAISLGFCGCLSTVSSFVHEVSMLWEKATLYDAYFYALTTMLSVHVICLAFLLPFSVHYSDCESGPGVAAVG